MKTALRFSEIRKEDIPLVGGKGANLGELFSEIKTSVPPGFVLTSGAFFEFLEEGSLVAKIKAELRGVSLDQTQKIFKASENIKRALIAAKIPDKIRVEALSQYHDLCGNHDRKVAVRSSATAEDLPEASFAGQQRTFVNILGEEELMKAIKGCWASLYEPRAIFYRMDQGFADKKVGLAVVVQLMVDSEVSGVMFTVDPLSNDRTKISIEGAYGLGEAVVSGSLTPDSYLVNKETFVIEDKFIAKQTWQAHETGKIPVSKAFQEEQKLSDRYIKALAEIAVRIEKHYGKPQDIEWCLDNGKLYIVQTRPVTTLISKQQMLLKEAEGKRAILDGLGACPGAAIGPVKIILNPKEIAKVKNGDVLVTGMTDPDYVPAMRRAVAIVTDDGGVTSHAAIVSREIGIPCIVGTGQATKMLKDGEIITVDGSAGKVYEGKLDLRPAPKIDSTHLKTATKVYVNLGDASLAEEMSKRNVDGVGLLRAEFMIAEIGEHPRAMIKKGKKKEFIQKLADGMLTFAKAFSPRPVVYRATDFKTNEYRNLKGGAEFEGFEENPLIGFRGASRYVSDPEVFNMELEAIKYVRNKMGYKNLNLMIPFARTVADLLEVKKLVSASGLRRSSNFQFWLMVEIPANVILLEDFLAVGVDGVSIGSNDLTMLTLGVDRDNSKLAKSFDERNKAVMTLLETIIKTCKKNKVTCSICGQAPSEYPEIVKDLVKWGITSVSVNPDVIDSVRLTVYEAEKEIVTDSRR
jgi:pyruvate,water dikinase